MFPPRAPFFGSGLPALATRGESAVSPRGPDVLEEPWLVRAPPGVRPRDLSGVGMCCRRRHAAGGGEDRSALERDDGELRRRVAQERADEEELVQVALGVRRERAPCGGEAGLDLEVRSAAGRQIALRRDAPAGDEERARVTRLRRRHDEAALDRTETREPVELAADLFKRVDPV